MKIRSFFDLLGDAKDVAEFFSNVSSVPQMISRLERLKRTEAEDFMLTLEALKISLEAALEDTFEMSANPIGDEDIDENEDEEETEDDESLGDEFEEEDLNELDATESGEGDKQQSLEGGTAENQNEPSEGATD